MNMNYWKDEYIYNYHEARGNKKGYITEVDCAISRYILERYGNVESDCFTAAEAEKTVDDLVSNPKVSSNKYIYVVFGWLRHYCSFICEHGGMTENPYVEIERPVGSYA